MTAIRGTKRPPRKVAIKRIAPKAKGARKAARFVTRQEPRYSPGYREAGQIANAFSAAQHNKLRELLGSEQLVRKLAGWVAGEKSMELLRQPSDADLAKTAREVHEAVARAQDRLSSAHQNVRNRFQRMLGRGFYGGLGLDLTLENLEGSLQLLKVVTGRVANQTAGQASRPGRPRDDRLCLLDRNVAYELHRAGIADPNTADRVFAICAAASDATAADVRDYIERERKRRVRQLHKVRADKPPNK